MFSGIDATDVLRDLDIFESEALAEIDKQFEAMGKRIYQLVYADNSFGGRSLRKSIKWYKLTENTLRVFTPAGGKGSRFYHASFVNDGTRPWTPRAGKLMRFVVGGKAIFRRTTGENFHHKARPATLFFERATNRAFHEALPGLEARMQSPIAKFNRGGPFNGT